jgi:hypothetical protein
MHSGEREAIGSSPKATAVRESRKAGLQFLLENEMKPGKKMQKRLERRMSGMQATLKSTKQPAAYRMPGSNKKR